MNQQKAEKILTQDVHGSMRELRNIVDDWENKIINKWDVKVTQEKVDYFKEIGLKVYELSLKHEEDLLKYEIAKQQEEFLFNTNSPEKLVEYFITNFIYPKAEEGDKGNLVIQEDNMNDYHIKICNKEIMLIIRDNTVNFVISDKSILKVEYENSIPRKVKINQVKISEELKLIHLKEMMSEVFNKQ